MQCLMSIYVFSICEIHYVTCTSDCVSVAFFCSKQVFALTIPMPTKIDVSTLHGTLITIDVEPTCPVWLVRDYIWRASPWDITPLRINADLAHLTAGYWDSELRICTHDKEVLQNHAMMGDECGQYDGKLQSLFKLVFIKTCNRLADFDLRALQRLADKTEPASGLLTHLALHDSLIIIEPLCGDGDGIVGLVYQSVDSYKKGDLRSHANQQIDFSLPVARAALTQANVVIDFGKPVARARDVD